MKWEEKKHHQLQQISFAVRPLVEIKILNKAAISTSILESILFICFATANILVALPFEQVESNRVPTVVFKGLPSAFHAFVISLIFAFNGAFCGLIIHNYQPKIVRIFSYHSIVSMASAICILVFAIFQDGDESWFIPQLFFQPLLDWLHSACRLRFTKICKTVSFPYNHLPGLQKFTNWSWVFVWLLNWLASPSRIKPLFIFLASSNWKIKMPSSLGCFRYVYLN